jgi:hypothetical protein
MMNAVSKTILNLHRHLVRIPEGAFLTILDGAYLEVQNLGKTPSMCDKKSAFNEQLSNCQQCIIVHQDTQGASFKSKVQPQYQQFLDFCSGIGAAVEITVPAATAAPINTGGPTGPPPSIGTAQLPATATPAAPPSAGSSSASVAGPASSAPGAASSAPSAASSAPGAASSGSSTKSAGSTGSTQSTVPFTGSAKPLTASNHAVLLLASSWFFVFLYA